jgi:twitching motility two-component system response regulator PilG
VVNELNEVATENGEGQNALRLHVRGLRDTERALLASVVRLSRRDTRNRSQPLELVGDSGAQDAEVFLIDARDGDAVNWARQQPWLASKPVIWLDANSVPAQHLIARRPLQWPVLTVLLARAIDHFKHPPASAEPVAPRMTQSARILVVDDSSVVRTQLRGLLGRHGFTVTEAANVAEAIGIAAASMVDCVFMDVVMPDVDGYEGCREVKRLQRDRALPVVMLTSKSSPFDRIRGRMAGCDAYLAKPVAEAELTQVLARILNSARDNTTRSNLVLSTAAAA